ncbi:MAG: transposase [Acidimicrobiales bacterium]
MEQRYRAVREVLEDGASVTDVARRYGVGRQAVHTRARGQKPKSPALPGPVSHVGPV